MDVKLPDGTVVQNVPDGMSKADLFSKLEASGHPVSPDWMKAAPPAATPVPAKPKVQPPGWGQEALQAAQDGMLRGGPVDAAMSVAGKGLMRASGELSAGIDRAGGWVADKAQDMGLSPRASAGVGYAANVGLNALPMLAGGEAAKVAAPLMKSGARDLMTRALKPSLKALKNGDAATAIQTMLDEGISATKGGVQKIRDKIGDLNAQITDMVASSPATVDKTKIQDPLLKTLDRFQRQVNPNSDVKAIQSAWDEFINHPLLSGGNDIPVPLAQDLKQGTYRQLASKYGELGAASTEAQKSIARGLKDGIAQAVPEISGLNARESKLIKTMSVLEKRVLMEANKNPAGLSLLSKNPAAWAAFMADRSSAFKSIVARMMNAGAEQIPATAARAGITAAQAVQPPPTE